MRQHTIAEKVSCTGVGLHTGIPVQMTLLPAPPDSGIVFVRTDGAYPVEVPAQPSTVTSTTRATSLGLGGVTIRAVEHLLSALYGLGIDNLRVEVDAAELPAMDGSAASFVYLIRSAGLLAQREPRCVLRIHRPIEVREGRRRIRLAPSRTFEVSYVVECGHPAIARQEFRVLSSKSDWFERELAAARTFAFLHDAKARWNSGLGRGGSLENTVVLDDQRVLNQDGLRWRDEFVRHKVLDLLGDLALIGVRIEGRIEVEHGDHALHHRLLAALLENPEAWWVHDSDPERRAAVPLTRSEAVA